MSEVVEKQRPGSKLNVGFWIRLLVAGTILGLIAWNNDWQQFGRELASADLRWFVAALALFSVVLLAGSIRWMWLLRVQEIPLPLREVWSITMTGFFFNQFLFGSTGGDLVKIFYAIRRAPDRKPQAMLSIVMDRVLGLVAVLVVTFALLPLGWSRLGEDPQSRAVLFGLAVVLAGILGGLAAAFVFPLDRLPAFFHNSWQRVPKREVFESLYQGLHAHGRQGRATAAAVATAICTVIPLLSIGWLLARSLNLDITYGPMTILFALVLCAMSVPLLPGGHGIREGAFLILFGVFGVTRDGQPVGEETALACSTLWLSINLVWSLFGGVVYLFFSSHVKRTEPNL